MFEPLQEARLEAVESLLLLLELLLKFEDLLLDERWADSRFDARSSTSDLAARMHGTTPCPCSCARALSACFRRSEIIFSSSFALSCAYVKKRRQRLQTRPSQAIDL